ncbi:MFS sugar transporter [Penicillium cinerascens]|uniref:MFS sugar transporter n=1 Tax=Penicillium cinerascens TaxID=70096 RepID=A0A9W9MPM1_9EURO|nr:MFS sugar transporter [Penicillium cinerascens]KAJ5205090.1 MFS sugar transporter [Penicillium cinerascens]
MGEGTDIAHEEVAQPPARRPRQPTFLGQTKAEWYIYWICGVASIANIFQGFDSGIYSVILADNDFIDYFDVRGARSGVVASMVNLGNVLGNFFVAWWFIRWMGRRLAFVFGTIVLLVGVALQAAAVAYAMLVIGRIVSGIGTAIIGTNLAAYQAEVSSPLIRGRVVSFVQVSYQVGVLIAYCVSLGVPKIGGNLAWRAATALQVIPGVILIVAAFTIPESPRWMLEKYPDKPERALKLLSRIRKLPVDDEEVLREHHDLVAAHRYRKEIEGEVTWRHLVKNYSVWKRVAYGMATMAIGQLSGVGALMIYGDLIFDSLGFSQGIMNLLLNVIVGVLALIASLVSSMGVDKWGRRITLITGCTAIVISYVLIGALADAFPAETNFNRSAGIMQVVCIYVIEMAYSGCLGQCAWIYASEIFPNHLRDKGINISQVGQQVTTLWINQTWPVMFDSVGHNAYYILMGINIVSLTVVVLFWPETKGISLEHMDQLFGGVDAVEVYEDKEARAQHIEESNSTRAEAQERS